MSGNISLLTVVFIVCYFIAQGRNEVVYTTITRDLNKDYFTNPCKTNCYEYGAVQEQGQSGRVCKCENSIRGSLFLRSEKRCRQEDKFMLTEGCEMWTKEYIELIDTNRTDKRYIFTMGLKYTSCHLESFISYRNGTTGEWQLFNSSGNVLVMENGPDAFSLQIKVTPLSSSRLRKFKGYVMKLGLNCTKRDGKSEEVCLLFKAKGDIHFPLKCSLPPTPPPTTTTTITTTTTPPPTTITTTTTQTGSSTPTVTATTTLSIVCLLIVFWN